MLDTKLVRVTGRGSNVNVTIDDAAPFDEALQALRSHVVGSRSLFSSGTVTVNVGRRILEKEELANIKKFLETETGVAVSRFWCQPSILEAALSQDLGMGVAVVPETQRHSPHPALPKQLPTEPRAEPLIVDDGNTGPEPESISHNDPRFQSSTERVAASPSAKVLPSVDRRRFTLIDPYLSNPFRAPWIEHPASETADRPLPVLTAGESGAGVESNEATAGPVGPQPTLPEAREPQQSPGNPERPQPAQARPSFTNPDRVASPDRGNEALLIKTNCRSGEIISYPGDIVIMADVNPGAQVIADGDIVVFGKLRGFAHAGAGGDPQATIIALDLQAPRLQIGPHTGLSPNSGKRDTGPRDKSNRSQPKIACVRRQSVYVENYTGRFGTYSGGTLYDG